MMGIYLVLVGVDVFSMFRAVPGGFVPSQDKQYLVGLPNCPTARRSIAPRTSSVA